MSDELEKTTTEAPKVEPVWGVAANVVIERPYGPGGKETKRGTRKFSGGAKIYVADVFWGMGAEQLMVVGHFRGRHGYVTSGIASRHLENFRAELIYSPAVIARICGNRIPVVSGEDAKQVAQKLAENLNEVADLWRKKSQKKLEGEAKVVQADDEHLNL